MDEAVTAIEKKLEGSMFDGSAKFERVIWTQLLHL
jgi:hypothetical protein